MANGSYFRFDGDNKMKYTYSHNRLKKNGEAEYAEPHMLHET